MFQLSAVGEKDHLPQGKKSAAETAAMLLTHTPMQKKAQLTELTGLRQH